MRDGSILEGAFVGTVSRPRVEGKGGEPVSGQGLEQLTRDAPVPVLSDIALEAPARRVSADEVGWVEVPVMKSKATTGALIGLAIDLTAIALLATHPVH